MNEKFINEQEPVAKKSFGKNFLAKITAKNIFKFIAFALIAAVYILLLGRMYLAGNHGVMNRFSLSEDSINIYTKDTEIFTQSIDESMDESGYYKVSNLVYIPQYGELQINVRYNNSTLDKLKEHYPNLEINGEPFIYILSDNNGTIYEDYEYIQSSNLIYNFRKLRFQNVNFENTERLYLTICPANDFGESSYMTVKFTVYNSENLTKESELKVKFGSKPDIFLKSEK